MIEKIKINNFQAHANLTVDLNAPITTIVGSSDTGKSAVLRALQWVLTNRPQGADFIRHGTKETKVLVSVDDQKVGRARSSSKNIYRYAGSTYKAIGTGVPSEIALLLNVDETNFQNQLDSPYLFALTGGQAAQELNRIVDLSAVDRCMSHVASEIRKTSSQIQVVEERLASAEQEIKDKQWSEACSLELEALQLDEEQIVSLEDQTESLSAAIDEIQKLRQKLKTANAAQIEFQRLEQQNNELVSARLAYQALQRLMEDVAECHRLKDVSLPSLAEVQQFEVQQKQLESGRQQVKSLAVSVREIQNCSANIQEMATKIKSLQNKLDQIEVCPTCHRPL